MSFLTHLECSECGKTYDSSQIQTLCPGCRAPLLARYDLAAARARMRKGEAARRPRGLWRWREILPVGDESCIVSLGEGDAPLLEARRLGAALGLKNLFIKDESGQPTGSFKARG